MSRFHPELNAFDIARMLVLGARDCLGELAASALAFVVSSPRVADWLIERAQRTPYIHIGEGPETYMYRYWLFNAYDSWTRKCKYAPFIKHSARIHEIMRPDSSRDHHDHPWDARTYILKGWYIEQREDGRTYLRQPGDTVAINFNEYHTIISVAPGGCTTLFVTGKYRGIWGFLVDGVKVPHFDYDKDRV